MTANVIFNRKKDPIKINTIKYITAIGEKVDVTLFIIVLQPSKVTHWNTFNNP